MLNINIKKSNLPILEEKNFVSSKKITIDIGLEWIIQTSFSNKNIVEIAEKLAIDLFLSKIEKSWDVYNAFSLVLEKLNKEFSILAKDYNLSQMNVFIWIMQSDVLHFSILWNYSVYLIKNSRIIDIAEGMQGKNLEFSYISTWNIGLNDMVFLSNLNLLDYISKDDIFEISRTDKIDKLEIIEQILSQEAVEEQYNIISISNENEKQNENKSASIDAIRNTFLSIKDKIVENEKVENLIWNIKTQVDIKNKYVYVSFLTIGILIAVMFLYMIIGSILNRQMEQSIPVEYKNKLIEAKGIIERTNKDIWNKEIFDTNIKKAENLIFEVRGKQLFLNDVKKLLDDISILKKQSNGIETYAFASEKSEIEFTNEKFDLVRIFEYNKKYYYIGRNSLIWPYIKGEPQKEYRYPDGEEALDADVTQEWNVYILTKTFRIIQFYKQDFRYINVEWQRTWEWASSVKSFNGNIYLLSDKKNQIYRHKPGINWFWAKDSLISEKDSKNVKIYDFGVDGWFYIIKDDLSMDKIFTTPTYSKRSIVINGLKNGSYAVTSEKIPKLSVWLNLNYVYLLMDNRIWIFESDSRNYKEVKSLRYVWQLEASEWEANSIFVPSDGKIYVGNEKWVYLVNFEISDNKIMVR